MASWSQLLAPFGAWWANLALYYGLLILLNELWNRARRPGFRVKNQHVFITGGATGLGLAFAKDCARRGAHVFIVSRSTRNLTEAAEQISKVRETVQQKVSFAACDVTDYQSVVAAVEQARREIGPIDWMICNAGLAIPGLISEQDVSIFRNQVDLNYMGMVHSAKAVMEEMMQRKAGNIVFINSPLSIKGFFGYSAYSASKAASRVFAEVLSHEMKPYNVRVSIFMPGNIDSPGFANENKTKHEITRVIEGASPALSCDEVSKHMISGLASGETVFHYDMLIGIMRQSGSGLVKRHNVFLELLMSPAVFLFHEIFLGLVHYMVKSGHKTKTR